MKLINLENTTENDIIATLSNEFGEVEKYVIDKTGKNPPSLLSEDQLAKLSITGKIRAGATIWSTVWDFFEKKDEVRKDYQQVDDVYWYPILIKNWEITAWFFIKDGDDIIPIDNSTISKLKADAWTIKKLKLSLKPSAQEYKLWDRVLLYWPTGTGKTFDFLSTVETMIKKKEISDYDILTITEWFEDIDFLAYIVPTTTWIKYTEKKIVSLLRDASKGKKIAILLDELNRWGKSFLNLILKLLDAVDGKNYVLNNFIADEQIVIPIENVLFFWTMNLWGKYVGTNALDEALFDRWNKVLYKWYNTDVEKDIIKNFGSYSSDVLSMVKHIRDVHSSWEIRAPISTRGIKMWAENFINTSKTKEDVFESFQITILNRLTSVDDFGNPNQEEMALILKKFRDLKYL